MKFVLRARLSENLITSPKPPVRSTKPSSIRPPMIASYEPHNLQERISLRFDTYTNNLLTYLAYAFSSKGAHISFSSVRFLQNMSPISGCHGNRSSITTSYHTPYTQKRKWKMPSQTINIDLF